MIVGVAVSMSFSLLHFSVTSYVGSGWTSLRASFSSTWLHRCSSASRQVHCAFSLRALAGVRCCCLVEAWRHGVLCSTKDVLQSFRSPRLPSVRVRVHRHLSDWIGAARHCLSCESGTLLWACRLVQGPAFGHDSVSRVRMSKNWSHPIAGVVVLRVTMVFHLCEYL